MISFEKAKVLLLLTVHCQNLDWDQAKGIDAIEDERYAKLKVYMY